MKIIVGLGNPGKKFKKTRHNLGFLVLDELQKNLKFEKFKNSKKFLAQISEGNFKGEKIILAKPLTFMNNSGKTVRLILENFKLKSENLWVLHDDLDILFGKIKISFGKSSAGHKGVESIIEEIKTKNFVRFRIGIKTPNQKKEKKFFVLSRFTPKEEKIFKKIIKITVKAIKMALTEGLEKAMTEFNK